MPKAAMNELHLSARGFHRVLKLARTINPSSTATHVARILRLHPGRYIVNSLRGREVIKMANLTQKVKELGDKAQQKIKIAGEKTSEKTKDTTEKTKQKMK